MGSEEEGGERISPEGLPSQGRKGYSAPTAQVEEEASPPNRDGGECPRNLKGDEESHPHPREEGRMYRTTAKGTQPAGGPRRSPGRI